MLFKQIPVRTAQCGGYNFCHLSELRTSGKLLDSSTVKDNIPSLQR